MEKEEENNSRWNVLYLCLAGFLAVQVILYYLLTAYFR